MARPRKGSEAGPSICKHITLEIPLPPKQPVIPAPSLVPRSHGVASTVSMGMFPASLKKPGVGGLTGSLKPAEPRLDTPFTQLGADQRSHLLVQDAPTPPESRRPTPPEMQPRE